MAPCDRVRTPKALRKEERISLERDFAKVFRQGRRVRTEYFTVVLCPNDLGIRRLAVVAPKRVGKAVVRNRMKRLAREFFRLNKCRLRSSTDYIFVARKGDKKVGYREVEATLAVLLEGRS